MRRQKLYSNMIREQNKTTIRSPCLPAKDLEANKKVARLKALEYAKTIAKPLAPVQSKKKDKQKVNLTEHAPYVEGLDLSQLTTLELLRKRHEQEKQAVEMLRIQHKCSVTKKS
ncbi:jhy protein homolog [Boleophthalmus pectinirostris]|uniref:jhy protein homolog n=1 Tax=Boleophthalmus pectinirostris TaxID=150288 RepID=UPI00242FC669|nr:jhy protein homolog [Boleophthalmus pectinirostris]